MGKTITPRIRCPLCGRLGWHSQFKNSIYPIEIIANIYNGGRANKNWYDLVPVDEPELLNEMKRFIAGRCKLIAERILGANNQFLMGFSELISLPAKGINGTTISMPMEVNYGK